MTKTIEHTGPNVLTVHLDVGSAPDFQQWVLLQADEHWDNPDCRRDLWKRHHDEALERGAVILKFGDFFCAMQGKYDKRSDKSKVRPEHQRGDYLDALVRTAADALEPYAGAVALIGRGNHEQSIRSRHETDLLERLGATLADRTGSKVQIGGYTGWVRFQMTRGTQRTSVRLWYCHGWGGGGPVTLNTIQAANRMPMMVEGFDVLCTGHVHESWVAEKPVQFLNNAGRVCARTRYIVQCPTYKDEYRDGAGGWHVETGKPPKPLGAWWMIITWRGEGPRLEFRRAD